MVGQPPSLAERAGGSAVMMAAEHGQTGKAPGPHFSRLVRNGCFRLRLGAVWTGIVVSQAWRTLTRMHGIRQCILGESHRGFPFRTIGGLLREPAALSPRLEVGLPGAVDVG